MIGWHWIINWKGLDECYDHLISVLFWYFHGETDENHGPQYSQHPGQYLNQAPPEYHWRPLVLHSSYLLVSKNMKFDDEIRTHFALCLPID